MRILEAKCGGKIWSSQFFSFEICIIPIFSKFSYLWHPYVSNNAVVQVKIFKYLAEYNI